MMSSSSGNCGSDRNRSVTHISTASTLPRDIPAIAPMITPTTTAISIAASPTASEMRPPYNIRASRSWPRSSVPSGCRHDEPCRRAVKSISLIGTPQSQGPNTTANVMIERMIAPVSASRWRRKRRQASMPSETCFSRRGSPPAASAVDDAGVEPAIEDVCQQVAENDENRENERHRHDHRRIVGENRADQQRADPGHAEDLLGDD